MTEVMSFGILATVPAVRLKTGLNICARICPFALTLIQWHFYHTAKAVVAALQTYCNTRTTLSLGASGQIDFAGVALGSLHASWFHIG